MSCDPLAKQMSRAKILVTAASVAVLMQLLTQGQVSADPIDGRRGAGDQSGVHCYRCRSRNYSDPSCHDPFEGGAASVTKNCEVLLGRRNLPASTCIKVHAVSGKVAGQQAVQPRCSLRLSHQQAPRDREREREEGMQGEDARRRGERQQLLLLTHSGLTVHSHSHSLSLSLCLCRRDDRRGVYAAGLRHHRGC